jgi:endonuclease YncB( thermonuclease family)
MYEYKVAEVLDVHDGDTCHLAIDLGMHVHINADIRIAHINAPELHEENGSRAKARLSELLSFTPLIIKTERDRTEKYGRWLGTITNGKGGDVGQTLIEEGLAVKYEGGRR